jgi:alkylation response protein AidB-like acyl-CoA dehydrogenase
VNFILSEEQQLLSDVVSRFVAREYSFEKRRVIKASAEGWSREIWKSLAELGLLALNIPGQDNEPEACAANTMVVMNALGGRLLLEPYLQSAVVATNLMRELASDAQRDMYFPAMAEGSAIAVVAALEPNARYDLAQVETRASAVDGGFVLQGRKAVVAHAPTADMLLVSARVHGAPGDTDGISVFIVPSMAAGLTVSAYRMLDGQRGGEVLLQDVFVPEAAQLGAPGQTFAAMERAHDFGIGALAAEAVGAMTSLLDATAEYLKTRQQFGQPLGRFQALQHRMAEMLIYCEQAKSISYLATAHCTSANATERRKVMSATKVLVCRAARFVRQQALQLHGGMGMTDELCVSHYFKRLMVIEATFGDADWHLERFIRMSRSG